MNAPPQHRLNFKALSRALSIRTQLAKYLKRFEIPIASCGEDHTSIRRCLTSGYFRNAAVLQPDGTYRSVREGVVRLTSLLSVVCCPRHALTVLSLVVADAQVLHAHPSSVLFTRTPPSRFVIYHEVIETTKRFMREITAIDKDGDWLVELAGHYYAFKQGR